MSKNCVVPGCKSAELQFFRFPTVKNSLTLLSEKRVEKWIRSLGFSKISKFDPYEQYVCGLHFVSGTPAKDTDIFNVDWAPTLNVPNCSTEPTENQAMLDLIGNVYSDVSTTSLCRACGQSLPDDPALSESFQDHAHTYSALILVELHSHENPEELRICLDCKNKLHDFEQFRDTCIRFHRGLLEVNTVPKNCLLEDDGTSGISEGLVSIIKVEPQDNFGTENDDDELKDIKSSKSSQKPTQQRKNKTPRKINTTSDEKQIEKTENQRNQNPTQGKPNWPTPKPKNKSFQHQFDCHCPRKCPSNFKSERTLQQFYDRFWECKNMEERKKLILLLVRAVPVAMYLDRDFTFHYFIPLEGKDVRVCRKFFTGILQISARVVYRCIGRLGVNTGSQ